MHLPQPKLFFRTAIFSALIFFAPKLLAFDADTPVTPGASREAQSLLAFFSDIYGKRILSGQQDGWRRGTNNFSAELNYIRDTTGKLPALLALDIGGVTDKSPRRGANHLLAQRALDWATNHNGIVEFCCHWRAPLNEPEFYTKQTSFDIARAVTEGTPEFAATQRDLDAMAAELEILRDAQVPVLWRPLHEANGRWFWWGNGGPEPFKKLWRLMFENFTVKHHLNNLIWIFSPGAEVDLADWYPGDAFVDIVGTDHYPMDGNHRPAKDIFDELKNLTRDEKMIALGENGPIPDIAQVVSERAGWLFFTTWNGSILFDKTTPEQLRADYTNAYVMNLEDLPDWKNFPVKTAETPVKLGFSALENVAVGGDRRLPLTVRVQDANEKTVRAGNFSVTLALEKKSRAKISGTLTEPTVNGVATFADVKINSPLKNCELLATADGLRAATSPAFAVGPGNGLLYEFWTNQNDFLSPADGQKILGAALESPVASATNFSARISGELIAPQSGDYKFSIAGAGNLEFWLGRDESAAGKQKINFIGKVGYQKWPHTTEAQTETVALDAGKKYYFEIRQRQRNGSTQLFVRWQLPGGREERPIPAFHFEHL